MWIGPGARHVAVLLGSAVYVAGKPQTHLTVHHAGGGCVCGCLLVQSWEKQVPGGVRVPVRPCEASSGGGEETVLSSCGVSESPVPEEKVPRGIERRGCCSGVRTNVGSVMMVMVVVSQGGRGRVPCGRLRGERCLASGTELMRAVVNFERAHAVCERIDPQSNFSVRHFAR